MLAPLAIGGRDGLRAPGRGAGMMDLDSDDAPSEPARAEIDAMPGPVLLEFGTAWCGYCRVARPLIARAFASHPRVRHLSVEDASGRRLGRSYGVKLWPTLVFLRDGAEIERLVRPKDETSIAAALAKIDPPS